MDEKLAAGGDGAHASPAGERATLDVSLCV
jgi:hypothetical protein